MAITTFTTAGEVINRAAAECGFAPVNDPLASSDAKFQQMVYLLNTAGEELSLAYPWEWLVKTATIDENTPRVDSGFEIPEDYYYIVPQTGWDTDRRLPLGGPLTAQEWTYLLGRDLVSSTLFSSFRLFQGKFHLYPSPSLTDPFTFTYEYIKKTWVVDADDPNIEKDKVEKSDDVVQYDKTLITRYLKLKFLESSGFDTTKAQGDFNQVFEFLTGKDKSAKVLNMGGVGVGYPYLSQLNVPDTNYGQ